MSLLSCIVVVLFATAKEGEVGRRSRSIKGGVFLSFFPIFLSSPKAERRTRERRGGVHSSGCLLQHKKSVRPGFGFPGIPFQSTAAAESRDPARRPTAHAYSSSSFPFPPSPPTVPFLPPQQREPRARANLGGGSFSHPLSPCRWWWIRSLQAGAAGPPPFSSVPYPGSGWVGFGCEVWLGVGDESSLGWGWRSG